jgi:hypothetical protein
MSEYKFYMQQDILGAKIYDLESDFNGMRYLKCQGLEDRGKPKNKYKEEYADSGELRVHEPSEICLEPTTITFTFLFVGVDRQKSFDDFYNYVKKGKFYYHDSIRRKQAYITLLDQVKPSEDTYKGGTPYMKADFKFQNLWGECKTISVQ